MGIHFVWGRKLGLSKFKIVAKYDIISTTQATEGNFKVYKASIPCHGSGLSTKFACGYELVTHMCLVNLDSIF